MILDLKLYNAIFKDPLILAHYLGYTKVSTPIHREWIFEMWRPGNSTLLAHRGSYKTTTRAIAIIWGLLFFPNTTILIIRKSDTEAQKILKEIMTHYEREPLRNLYLTLFGITEPRDLDNWSKQNGINLVTRTKISKEKQIETVGVGKYPTGSHFDLIWPDDVVTPDDRYYEGERERTKIYIKELINILNRGQIGIKFSGTPWHEDDAFGDPKMLITKERVFEYPVSLRFIAELTDSEIEMLKEQQGESLYAANYELKHVADTEKLLANPQFEDCPEGMLFGYLDPAFTDRDQKDNDYSALTIGTAVHDQMMYIKYGCIWQKEIDEIYDLVEAALRAHEVSVIFVEANAAQKAVANEFKQRGFIVRYVYHHKNKHFRIINYGRKYWKFIRFANELKDSPYLKQITGYNLYAKKKDAPDSLAGFVQACVGEVSNDDDGFDVQNIA